MRILMLAGGFDSIALIKILQNRGHEVLLADYLVDPPAKEYAKKHFQVSTLDEKAIYELAVAERVDLLTSVCTDQALMTVAKVSERLGLPCYIDSKTAKNVTNKAYMKKKFIEFGIPTAQSIVLEENEKFIESIFNGLRFPLIVKPCDCNSSKGVVKVVNQNELPKAVNDAFDFSRSKKVIIENFIEGEEVSIDVWKDHNGAKILSVSKTNIIKSNKENFTIYQSEYPVKMTSIIKEKIQNIAEKISEAFVLENCPILIQAIINDDNISVIEFSARMGGGSKYKLIEYISGIDIMSVYANRILGDIEQTVVPRWSKKAIELDYVYAEDGIFERLIGFEDALKSGDICEVFQYKKEGSLIVKRITSSDRIVGFLIQADNHQALRERRYRVLERVDILNAEGNSIMCKDCFY